MKIAVPVKQDNEIDGHFGQCSLINIFTISGENKISEIKTVQVHNINPQQKCGCKSGIGQGLAAEGVKTMLVSGIGQGAVNVLSDNGIKVVRGCDGDASEAVRLYLSGLIHDKGSSCIPSDSHHGHQCSHS